MTESPSALLERAAAHLERLADAAPQAPWRLAHDGDVLGYGPVPIIHSEYGDVEVEHAPGVTDWITTMSPAVARPLAAILRFDARRLSWATSYRDIDRRYEGFTLARMILGELPDESEGALP